MGVQADVNAHPSGTILFVLRQGQRATYTTIRVKVGESHTLSGLRGHTLMGLGGQMMCRRQNDPLDSSWSCNRNEDSSSVVSITSSCASDRSIS